MPKFIDRTGQRFGRLLVISKAESRYRGGRPIVRWNCLCDCGNTITVDAGSLSTGNTRSCGCLFKETVCKTKNRKTVPYIFHGDYVEGALSNGKRFMVDAEDYEKIKDYGWHTGTREGYIAGRILGTHNFILLHRLIMDAKPGEDVDHINHDPLDNRKCNLRVVTHAQNMKNVKRNKRNKSGCSGVYHHKNLRGAKQWTAYISVDKKMKHLGLFETYDEAVAARKAAEKQYYGEYSYDHSVTSVLSPKPGTAPPIPAPISTSDTLPLNPASIPAPPTLVPVP